VRTKTLTRFPTNGCTTEPELRGQVDLDLEPKRYQPMMVVRTRGDVLIQFASMHIAPFDTEAGRDELRLALNEKDGVEIAPRKVRRWPAIPLAILEEPANLDRFVAVLDRLATREPYL
jgi:hypothetical protein